MNPVIFNFILIIVVFALYKYQAIAMSAEDSNKKLTQEELDKHNFDPDNLIVNIGGKQVPFSSINKPHHVVINPQQHKPQVNAETFPDVEADAKQKEEAKVEAAKAHK